MRTNEIKNEIDETKKLKEKTKQKDLKYEIRTYSYHFQKYEKITSFDESVYTRKASIVKTEENQSNLLENLEEFNNKSRPKNKEGKDEKIDTYENANVLYECRELTLHDFKCGIFSIKATQGEGLKY